VRLAPADLVSAHAWDRVAFTTYALSLSFFEAVILDALLRGGGRSHALILADVQGVKASLSEQGARRVGKDYEVEPIAVSHGVFHPKVSVFMSRDECHVLVGSGNLTFGGWGGNCELIEHLHPAFAAAAISDVADFFELLPVCERVRQGADAHCESIAAALRRSVEGNAKGALRVFHNLDVAIGDQIVQAAADLGGARRLVAASPYWDNGAALDRLCKHMGLAEVFVHAHAHGCVEGRTGNNWPRHASTPVRAVRLDVMSSGEQASRPLHAKALEVLCRDGRLLVSGSANCTTAALGRNGNVEACVVRIQRERHVGWSFIAAEPLSPRKATEEDGEGEQGISGVLRAVLQGEEVLGQVLTPEMSGLITVSYVGHAGPELLGNTELTPDACFCLRAPALEPWSWRGGRLVIRVTDSSGLIAEGFVSVASYADITARAGIVGRRLFALLAGHETPPDVAAILSWFYEDPHRLLLTGPDSKSAGVSTERDDTVDRLIPVAALSETHHPTSSAEDTVLPAPSSSWTRFIAQVLRTFREARGPLAGARQGPRQDHEEEDEEGATLDLQPEDPAVAKSLSNFEKLLDSWLRERWSHRMALIAFDLTQYICDRFRPEEEDARRWLAQLLRALLGVSLPVERRDDVAAAVLTALGAGSGNCRWARSCLLRLGIDLDSEPPSALGVQGFQTVLPQRSTFPVLWAEIRSVRTYPEQLRSYRQALETGKPGSSYGDLAREAPEEWPILERAITSSREQQKLVPVDRTAVTCPRCFIRLPAREIHKLRTVGLATAMNCCNKVLICQVPES
jgi:hypothetical protein